MDEEDYKLTPTGHLGSRVSVSDYRHLGTFDTTEEALDFVAKDMDRNRFYPAIWWVSDHGNAWMIDLDGEEIVEEEVE